MQAIKDWHLAVAVGALVGIITVMVTLSAAVPPLWPDIELSEDQEKQCGRTVCHMHVIDISHLIYLSWLLTEWWNKNHLLRLGVLLGVDSICVVGTWICLPHFTTSRGFILGIQNVKGENQSSQRLKISCCSYIRHQHCHGSTNHCYIHPGHLHCPCWGHVLCWTDHCNNNIPSVHLCTEGTWSLAFYPCSPNLFSYANLKEWRAWEQGHLIGIYYLNYEIHTLLDACPE